MDQTSKHQPTKQAPVNSVKQQMQTAVALSLAGQLLVVVLLPVLAGYWLDSLLNQSPFWTMFGIVVAVSAATRVVYLTYKKVMPAEFTANDEDDA